jgi:probable rRNA maturation factor
LILAIRFFNEEISFKLSNKRIVSSWIKDSITSYQFKTGDVNFIFTHNDKILEVNKQFLNHDYFTDIITFNYNTGNIIAGDIYISIDTVKENSKSYSVAFINELHRVMIHGILHLLGYNDSTSVEKIKMRNLENLALEKLESKYLIK